MCWAGWNISDHPLQSIIILRLSHKPTSNPFAITLSCIFLCRTGQSCIHVKGQSGEDKIFTIFGIIWIAWCLHQSMHYYQIDCPSVHALLSNWCVLNDIVKMVPILPNSRYSRFLASDNCKRCCIKTPSVWYNGASSEGRLHFSEICRKIRNATRMPPG